MEYRVTYSEDHLEHHGILGQKWGVRRYQNEDGTLTSLGKKRYKSEQKIDAAYDKYNDRIENAKTKFIKKGENRKVEIADEMIRQNNEAREEKKKQQYEGEDDYEKKSLKSDMQSVANKPANLDLKLNDMSMTSWYSRMSEDNFQKNVLANLKGTKVSQLDKVSINSGLTYLEKIASAKVATNQYGSFVGINAAIGAENYYNDELKKEYYSK